jgi:hypothetical protein
MVVIIRRFLTSFGMTACGVINRGRSGDPQYKSILKTPDSWRIAASSPIITTIILSFRMKPTQEA